MDRQPLKRDPSLMPLSQEHHNALLLAFRCKQAARAPSPAALVQSTLATWSALLIPHFRAEEEILAPLLLAHLSEESPGLTRLLRDHLALHGLMHRVRAAEGSEAQIAALVAFGDRLERHVRFEERELFGEAQALLTAAEKAELTERLPQALAASCPLPPR